MDFDNFKEFIENAPVMWRKINSLGIILDCNKTYAKKLGYAKDEIIGKSIFDHLSDESWDNLKKSLDTWAKTGQVSNLRIQFKKKDGTTFPVLLSATTLYDDEGIVQGSNTIIFDISDINEPNQTNSNNQKAELVEAENQKLRKYISLLLSEIDLSKRYDLNKNDYPKDDKKSLPILEKISELHNARIGLESELEI